MSAPDPIPLSRGDCYRFDAFEVRAKSGLLFHEGVRVRVQELPLRMLLVLLDHAGEVVSREQLRQHLWGKRTFVEFDSGLRVAVAKLREALGDHASQPRYLETVARRGYRFIGVVERIVEPASLAQVVSPSLAAEPVLSDAQVVASLEPLDTAAQAVVPSGSVASPDPSVSLVVTVPEPIAQKSPVPESADALPVLSPPAPKGAGRRRLLAACGLGAAALLVIAGSLSSLKARGPLVQPQDPVVVGRLVDPAGDHALDDLLSAPFRVKIGESPYLRVVPNEQFAHALPQSAAPSLAEELQACRQVPARVLLAGEVMHSGSAFDIDVSAYDCAQGTRIARTSASANSRDELLSALSTASDSLRLRLGESPSSLARFNVPLGQATTTSLAALRAYRLGEQQHLSGEDTRARTYFLLAVDLDPQFALAYLQLGRAHSNAGEFTMSRTYYQRAFALRERTTDRERLYITTSYYSYATGEKERAVEAYQLWSTLYPQDVVPANNLAVEYLTLGRFPEALVAARRAIELDPSLPVPYASLALAYLRSGSLDELRKLCSDPARQTSGSVAYHLSCYEGAVARADPAGMDREMHWARGNPEESVLLGSAATVAFRKGQIREARKLYDDAVSNALSNKLPEYAALLRIDLATEEANVGMSSLARQDALDAVSMGPDGSKEEVSLALVWALLGDVDRANEGLQKAAEQSPLDTLLNQALIPQVRAILALKHAKPLEALQYLERVRPYDLCNELDLSAAYYRGVALLQAGDRQRAASELATVVAQDRSFPHSLEVVLAQLQAARIALTSGDLPKAAALARDLTHYWQTADADFPPLRELQALNRELTTQTAPAGLRD